MILIISLHLPFSCGYHYIWYCEPMQNYNALMYIEFDLKNFQWTDNAEDSGEAASNEENVKSGEFETYGTKK